MNRRLALEIVLLLVTVAVLIDRPSETPVRPPVTPHAALARPALPPALAAHLPEPSVASAPAPLPRRRLHFWRRHVVARLKRERAQPPAAAPLPPEVATEIAVRTAVRALLPVARACYDQSLKRDPRLGGDATFRLELDGRARVAAVAVEQGLPDGPELVACLGRVLHRAALPRTAANMEVEVPFRLEVERTGPLARR